VDRIVCLKRSRKASGGSTISFIGKTYQLLAKTGSVLPLSRGAKIEVLTHLDGSLNTLYEGKSYELKEYQTSTAQASPVPIQAKQQVKTPHSPPATHPWRQPCKPRKRNPDSGKPPYDGFWEDVYAV